MVRRTGFMHMAEGLSTPLAPSQPLAGPDPKVSSLAAGRLGRRQARPRPCQCARSSVSCCSWRWDRQSLGVQIPSRLRRAGQRHRPRSRPKTMLNVAPMAFNPGAPPTINAARNWARPVRARTSHRARGSPHSSRRLAPARTRRADIDLRGILASSRLAGCYAAAELTPQPLDALAQGYTGSPI
jgi:hypothetical protein